MFRESIWARGWNDFKLFHGNPWVWVGELLMGTLFSVWTSNGFVLPLVFLCLATAILVGFTARAPFRQRDEAYKKIDELDSERPLLECEILECAIKAHDDHGLLFALLRIANKGKKQSSVKDILALICYGDSVQKS